MKNTFKKAAIAATLVSGLGAGVAQADTFQALLSIVAPIAISENTQMDFSTVNADTDGQTCTIEDAAGARTETADGCYGAGNGVAAILDVAGSIGLLFDISDSGTTANGMRIEPTLLNDGLGGTATSGVALGDSHQLIYGGTLTIDSATTAADVADTVNDIAYDVTVAYQ